MKTCMSDIAATVLYIWHINIYRPKTHMQKFHNICLSTNHWFINLHFTVHIMLTTYTHFLSVSHGHNSSTLYIIAPNHMHSTALWITGQISENHKSFYIQISFVGLICINSFKTNEIYLIYIDINYFLKCINVLINKCVRSLTMSVPICC